MPPFYWPLVLYALILVLHVGVPARTVDGYVRDRTGQPLRYRLNGLWVFILTVAAWVAACRADWLRWDSFYVYRWQMAAGACVLGVAFTLVIVLPFPRNRSLGADLYLGRLENPQWRAIDAKMALYLLGAILLELNVLSFAAFHVQTFADQPSSGVLLYALLFTFFIAEYLSFEEVHLYTYDFVAERVGFKLGWGCLVFYPFFYPVGLWTTADLPNPHTPVPLLVLCGVLFFAGWVLSRGANLQKFQFKQDPTAKAFGLLEPRAISGEGQQVLAGGFWSLSRHINYLGEIVMACALALSLGHPGQLGPWLYPLYYVALLLPRQAADDRRCAQKYGALWVDYCKRVPWRIIPRIY